MGDLDRLFILADPVRRALFEYIAAQDDEVGRAEAAEAVGVGLPVAAFHLDKLAAAGLLRVSHRRLTGRAGPGAGRPAKLYRPAETEVAVSLPPRAYDMAAEVLAAVVDRLGAEPELQSEARRAGAKLAAGAQSLPEFGAGSAGVPPADTGSARDDLADMAAVLAARGYRPRLTDGILRLRNCPFHQLAIGHPPLICGMNLALLEGLAEEMAPSRLTVRMDPGPDGCCVTIASKSKLR